MLEESKVKDPVTPQFVNAAVQRARSSHLSRGKHNDPLLKMSLLQGDLKSQRGGDGRAVINLPRASVSACACVCLVKPWDRPTAPGQDSTGVAALLGNQTGGPSRCQQITALRCTTPYKCT